MKVHLVNGLDICLAICKLQSIENASAYANIVEGRTWTSMTLPVSLSKAARPTSRATPRPSKTAVIQLLSQLVEIAVCGRDVVGLDCAVQGRLIIG